MSEQFQVVAATTGRERAIVLRLSEEIGQAFSVDLSGLIDALSDTGVCVGAAGSLVEARRLGAQLLAIGADFVILDEDGEEVDSQQTTPPRIESTRPEVGSKTMMGGFNAPEVIALAKSQAASAKEKLELEDDGGFAAKGATIAEGAISVGAPASGKLELEDDGGFAAKDAIIGEGALSMGAAPSGELELEDDGGFAAKGATIDEGAVSISAAPSGKLELEEGGGYAAPGSRVAQGAIGLGAGAEKLGEGEIELDSPGGFADAASTIGEGAVDVGAEERLELSEAGSFAAPATAKDGFDLDSLDADALVMLDGSSDSLGLSAAPSKTPSAPVSGVHDSSFLPPDAGELQTEEALELEHPPPPPEPASLAPIGDEGEPTMTDDGELEWAPADKPATDRGKASSQEASTPEASASPTGERPAAERPRPRSIARRTPSAPLLLGGKLRTWPRARVAAGFILCVGLSSILPMCHASSVQSDRIKPLLLELSTAKAHGAIMASTPGYQPPEQIESTINSISQRYTIYMMLLWSVLAALLLFLWFRFT